jgi:hypothetical protein
MPIVLPPNRTSRGREQRREERREAASMEGGSASSAGRWRDPATTVGYASVGQQFGGVRQRRPE